SYAKLAIPTKVEKEEKLVLAVDQFRDVDRAAQSQVEALAEAGCHNRRGGQLISLGDVPASPGVRDIPVINLPLEKMRGVQAVVPVKPVGRAVQEVGAGAGH